MMRTATPSGVAVTDHRRMSTDVMSSRGNLGINPENPPLAS